MLIKNTQPRLHQIGIRDPKAPAAQAVSIINLLPGVNEIEKETWDHAAKNPMVKLYLKNKVFEIVDAVDGLKSKSPADALALVGDTYDLKLLDRWAEEDGRAKIQKAIQAQIALIHAAGDPEKKEE